MEDLSLSNQKYQEFSVWKHVPTDEHWISLSVDVVDIEPYTSELMFSFLDLNNDTVLEKQELLNWTAKMKEYGKTWKNKDIDNVNAVEYYIKWVLKNATKSVNSGHKIVKIEQISHSG